MVIPSLDIWSISWGQRGHLLPHPVLLGTPPVGPGLLFRLCRPGLYHSKPSYLGVVPLSATWGPAGLGMVAQLLKWKQYGPGPSASKVPTPSDWRSYHPTLDSLEVGSEGKSCCLQTTNNSRKNVNIFQWKAGVYSKKIALVERLHEENIEVACLQETPEITIALQQQGI